MHPSTSNYERNDLNQFDGKNPQDALCFKNISVKFGDYIAVSNTSFSVKAGEFVSVVGPTGCGKSTLLNIAAGLLEPSEGEIKIFGMPLNGGMSNQVGYLFQSEALMPWRTAIENIMVGLQYRNVSKDQATTLANHWLARVGLTGHGHRYPHQLSGGMRKRVSLAQTMILDPKIILMDEPFSALDVQTRQLMENELLDLWSADKKSIMFITHDLEEAIALSDRVIVLSAGPETHPIAEFVIDLPRPRDMFEVRVTEQYIEYNKQIWAAMKKEVLKAYQYSKKGDSHD
jgi:NitT/TauT family transport system ATP-binding protein